MKRLPANDASILAIVAEHRGLPIEKFAPLLEHATHKRETRLIAEIILATDSKPPRGKPARKYPRDLVETAQAILTWSSLNERREPLVASSG